VLIRRFTVQMLASLQLMRSHRIVHCDLKPEVSALSGTLADVRISCFAIRAKAVSRSSTLVRVVLRRRRVSRADVSAADMQCTPTSNPASTARPRSSWG
jgi:serine/threonine protein kinase